LPEGARPAEAADAAATVRTPNPDLSKQSISNVLLNVLL
jgi:hypothetical protein